jgi:hypothetical protein
MKSNDEETQVFIVRLWRDLWLEQGLQNEFYNVTEGVNQTP